MTFALYAATALTLLALMHRFVRPISYVAALVLFVLPLGITGYAIATGGVYGPIDYPYSNEPLRELRPLYGVDAPVNASAADIYGQMFPWRRSVQASLERGEWPLWNAYMLGGHLLAGSAQSAPYSPFTLIACLLPAAVSFTYTASIALFIAACGAFLLARDVECSEAAALIAAAGWMFAASTVNYIHTAMGFASVYQPMLMLSASRVARKPRLASGALLTIVLSLMVVTGHPETLFLSVLVACAFGLFEMVRARIRPWRAVATALAGGVAALLFCAIHLLPFAEAMAQSAELEIKQKYWSDTPRSLPNDRVRAVIATDLFPHLHIRYWLKPAFGFMQAETWSCGSLILGLALYAACRKRSSTSWFLLSLAVLCGVLASGWHPAVAAAQKIPLLEITHLERLAFTAALLLAMLAALGVDEIVRRRDHHGAAIILVVTLAGLAGGTVWLQKNIILAIAPTDFGDYKVFAELFFAGLAALFLLFVRRQQVLVAALLVLIAAQRIISVGGTFRTFPAEAAYPPVPILEPLKSLPQPFRVVGHRFALLPATATFYGLEDVRGWEALTFAPFVHTWRLWCEFQVIWFNRVDDLSTPFLSFLNVRYAVVSKGEPTPPGWRRVAEQRGAALLENERVVERAFVPRHVRLGLTMEDQFEEMSGASDFRDKAWITASVPVYERENGPGSVIIQHYSPGGRYLIEANMARDGWVVLSENAWKGWRAYIDGRRVEIQRANAAYLSVFVPEGRHLLRIVYWPDSFVRGRAITFAMLLGTLIMVIVRMRHRRVRSEAGQPPAPGEPDISTRR